MIGDADLCKAASDLLLSRHNIHIQPINYPTVAIGTERLRITPTPRHSEAHVSNLVAALVDVWRALELPFTMQALPLRPRGPSPESFPGCDIAAE
jgi:5-aminolevulinate synthase